MGTFYRGSTHVGLTPGLVNLVGENPKSPLAYTTETPNADIAVNAFWGDPRFKTTVSQPASWSTLYLPATPGKWYGSRVGCIAATTGHYIRVYLQFYSYAAGVYTSLAASATSASFPGDFTNKKGPTAQAPANTAFVKLVFNFYNGTGTANPLANAEFVFNGIVVAGATYPEELTMKAMTESLPQFAPTGPALYAGNKPVLAAYRGATKLWEL